MINKTLLIVAGLCTAGIVEAQLVCMNDQSGTVSIYMIDVNTGVTKSLYSTSASDQKAWGMAADNVNGILYWNSGSTLCSATYAGLLSGTPTITKTSLTYNGSTVNYVGLGYNPATGKLMGTRNIATEAVYAIDPASGVGNLLWAYSTSYDFGGVDFDAASGKLYGLSDSGGTGLYEIDYVGKTVTLKAPYPGGETDIDGLAVDNGIAYYVTDGPNTSQRNFYVYDVATGNLLKTLPSPFTGSGTFCAAAYAPGLVPEPATLVAVGVGLATLARRRYRK